MIVRILDVFNDNIEWQISRVFDVYFLKGTYRIIRFGGLCALMSFVLFCFFDCLIMDLSLKKNYLK